MSRQYGKKQAVEKSRHVSREKEKPITNLFSRNLKRIYPIGLQRTCSTLSLSSLSLSLSQNSTDSSLTDTSTTIDHRISLALRLIAPAERREVLPLPKIVQQPSSNVACEEGPRRCNWITKNSGKVWTNVSEVIAFAIVSWLSTYINKQNMPFFIFLFVDKKKKIVPHGYIA